MQPVESIISRITIHGMPNMLDNSYPSCKPLMRIPLYHHQGIVVKAMFDLEQQGYIKTIIVGKSTELYVFSTTIMLAEPLGSGKTIEVLGLIALSPIPPYIKPTAKHHTVIKATLIVVGPSVCYQWCNAIEKFTTLSYARIDNIYQFRKFCLLDTLPDIVVLKNGTMSDGDTKVTTVEAMKQYAEQRKSKWARVVYDDFDVCSIKIDEIPYLWRVLVSSTDGINAIQRRTFEVRFMDYYRSISLKIPKIYTKQYKFHNADGTLVQLLGTIDNMDTMVEMLNGDAIQTAAEKLGIKSKSVADIFSRVLDNNYTKYIRGTTISKYFNEAIAKFTESDEPQEPDYVVNLIKCIKRGQSVIPYGPCATLDILNNTKDKYDNEIKESSHVIERIKGNIKDGICQVCALPLENQNTFINKCCGVIICDVCGTMGNKLRNRGDTIVGKCVNCLTDINVTDMIFINRTFNVETLVQSKGDEDESFKEEPKPTKQPSKLDALLSIVRNEPINGTDVTNSVHYDSSVMDGIHILPSSQHTKTIIFASFEESLNNISDLLTENKVRFLKLGGQTSSIHKQVTAFRNDVDILLVNSSLRCAGLNLEFATDVIFYHKIIDPKIAAQVICRAQRIGRTSNLQVHTLLYTEEF
jgi:SNF2 family DNA or RNA helicase